MTAFAQALLAELDDDALDKLARLLAPHLREVIGAPESVPATAERLMTASEAAARANVNVETIRRAARSGALAASSAGRAVRINPDDLVAWLAGPRQPERAHAQTRQLRRSSGRKPMGDAIQRLANQ